MISHLIPVILYVILMPPIVLVSTYYIFGFLPNIKACSLNEEQKKDILECGIAHCTTERYADLISAEMVIKSSNWIKSYSNHFHKCVYFYSVKYMDDKKVEFNTGTKKNAKIIINNLTEQQINKFKIRRFDNSLMYNGNFQVLDENNLIIQEINKLSQCNNSKQGFHEAKKQFSKYTLHLFLTAALPLCVFTSVYWYIAWHLMFK